MTYKPRSLADFLPDKMHDDFGYNWCKQERQHTLEFVGYDEDVEIGSIVIATDGTQGGNDRAEYLSWAVERANIKSPDGISLRSIQEEIRLQYETYGIE